MGLWNYILGNKQDKERVKYLVKGTAGDFNVTFKCSGDCDPVQEEHVPKGWKHTFSVKPGEYYYVSVQSNQRNSSVELKVYQNGKLFRKAEKEGDYPLVTVSGFVC
jgi:hypothetical protein